MPQLAAPCLLSTCRILSLRLAAMCASQSPGRLQPCFTASMAGRHSDRLPSAHTCFNHLILHDLKVWCLLLAATCCLASSWSQACSRCIVPWMLCWPLQDSGYLQQRLLVVKTSTCFGMEI